MSRPGAPCGLDTALRGDRVAGEQDLTAVNEDHVRIGQTAVGSWVPPAQLSQRDIQPSASALVVGRLVEQPRTQPKACCVSESTVPPPAASSIVRSVVIMAGS
jgi:hypothetical protein